MKVEIRPLEAGPLADPHACTHQREDELIAVGEIPFAGGQYSRQLFVAQEGNLVVALAMLGAGATKDAKGR
jgi:hypothetical protein